jgi:hypothetical protein
MAAASRAVPVWKWGVQGVGPAGHAVRALIHLLGGPYRDRDEPRLQGGGGLPLPEVPHRLQEGLLHGILRILGVPTDARGDAVQAGGIPLHKERVGALPPLEAGGNQLLIGQGRHPAQDTGRRTAPAMPSACGLKRF